MVSVFWEGNRFSNGWESVLKLSGNQFSNCPGIGSQMWGIDSQVCDCRNCWDWNAGIGGSGWIGGMTGKAPMAGIGGIYGIGELAGLVGLVGLRGCVELLGPGVIGGCRWDCLGCWDCWDW